MSNETTPRSTLKTRQPQEPTSSTRTESEAASHVEIDDFVFDPKEIQGFYHIEAPPVEKEDEEDDDQKTPPPVSTTVIHLERWVSPIGRPDPEKKLYYYLRKVVKPTLVKI